MTALGVLNPTGAGTQVLYIIAFSMFIIGVRQGTHPTTARRGNLDRRRRHGGGRRHHPAA